MTTLPQSAGPKPNVASVMMPAPTAWPFVLALGVALVFAGLLVGWAVSVLGAGLYLAGAVGWFGELFPLERHELVAVAPEPAPEVARREVTRVRAAEDV